MTNQSGSPRKPTRTERTGEVPHGSRSWRAVLQSEPLFALLREGIKAVPRVKFAVGVLAIVSAGLIAAKIAGSPIARAAAFAVVLAAMFLLWIFHLMPREPGAVQGIAQFIIWSVAILFVASLGALFVAAVVGTLGFHHGPGDGPRPSPGPSASQVASGVAQASVASAASATSTTSANSFVVGHLVIVDKRSYFKHLSPEKASDSKEADLHWGTNLYKEDSWYSTRQWRALRDCLRHKETRQ